MIEGYLLGYWDTYHAGRRRGLDVRVTVDMEAGFRCYKSTSHTRPTQYLHAFHAYLCVASVDMICLRSSCQRDNYQYLIETWASGQQSSCPHLIRLDRRN